ncbi:hypothetical protein OG866_25220 [Streptomyces sp. NBC_00663]|uniref:hypothetical protein n=1 Tax=Streptomyces sp. NBC_00663 TaxID=2975801 RepID=UPI002E300423|nr:hypothetical protein [Streptomyces sp. NBC_00663]
MTKGQFRGLIPSNWPFDDGSCPGFVEVRPTDAHGRQWIFLDKVPIFDDGDALSPEAAYPVDVRPDQLVEPWPMVRAPVSARRYR